MRDGRLKARRRMSGRQLLEQWIIRHRLKADEAAEELGISAVSLSQYLNAHKKPSLAVAIEIEDTCGIGVRTWLRDDAPTVENPADGTSNAGGGVDTEVNRNLAISTQSGRT